MLQDRLDHVRVVIDAELIGRGQQQHVGFRDPGRRTPELNRRFDAALQALGWRPMTVHLEPGKGGKTARGYPPLPRLYLAAVHLLGASGFYFNHLIGLITSRPYA